MDFNIHIAPKFRSNKKEHTMNDKTINVNDEISKANKTITEYVIEHPAVLVLSGAALLYIGYNYGRNKSMMDVMRIAAMAN